jgi:chromosome partitioning protein
MDSATPHGDPKRPRVLALANQKGGVGKTTTAVNLGAYLAVGGLRVLLVDIDPQGNATSSLGIDKESCSLSIYDVLTDGLPLARAAVATAHDRLLLVPSTSVVVGAEAEAALAGLSGREQRLADAVDTLEPGAYDIVLVDCPPSLGLLTLNALTAADGVLIPIQTEYYALEGLSQLVNTIRRVRAALNPRLEIEGVVLTMFDGRTRLSLQVADEVRRHLDGTVYETVVPRSVRLSEAPSHGLPIALYAPASRGAVAYRSLAGEVAARG